MDAITIGKYTVRLQKDTCISAKSCVSVSPEVFSLDQTNHVDFAGGTDSEDVILLAAQSCPTGAIEIYEGEKKVWPL